MWAARIVHEASLHDQNCFITLTYREPHSCTLKQLNAKHHIPEDLSLNKRHWQLFMKRLRKKFPEPKISYYHVGEYGEELSRPHYHACLFNFDFDDKIPLTTATKVPLHTSPTLETLWPYGFSTIGQVNFKTAAYCARYALKKKTGDAANEHYATVDQDGVLTYLQPEYSTMSRRPGIAREWYKKYKDDVFPSDELPIPGHGVINTVPRYYDQLLMEENETLYNEIKRERLKRRNANIDEYTPQRLDSKRIVTEAKLKLLKRGLEQ